MTKVRHIDFYPDEWLAGTATLEPLEVCIYITACAMIYSHGGAVLRDEIRRRVRCHGNAFNRAIARLLDLGKLSAEGGEIANKRCGKELEKAEKRVGKAQENGRKSNGRPIKNNDLENPAGKTLEKLTTNHQPPTYIYNLTSPQPWQPARAREGAREGAGMAGWLADSKKISEEWIAAAVAERERAGLPPVDMLAEARKCSERWERDPPRYPERAWLGYALRARAGAEPAADEPYRRTDILTEAPPDFVADRLARGLPHPTVEDWFRGREEFCRANLARQARH